MEKTLLSSLLHLIAAGVSSFTNTGWGPVGPVPRQDKKKEPGWESSPSLKGPQLTWAR